MSAPQIPNIVPDPGQEQPDTQAAPFSPTPSINLPPPPPALFEDPFSRAMRAMGKQKDEEDNLRKAGMLESAIRDMAARSGDIQGMVKVRVPFPGYSTGPAHPLIQNEPVAEGLGGYYTVIEPWWNGETQQKALERGRKRAETEVLQAFRSAPNYLSLKAAEGYAWPGPIDTIYDKGMASLGFSPGWRDFTSQVERDNPGAGALGVLVSLAGSFASGSVVSRMGKLAGRAMTWAGTNIALGMRMGIPAAKATAMGRFTGWFEGNLQRFGRYAAARQIRRVSPEVLSEAAKDFGRYGIKTTPEGYLQATNFGFSRSDAPGSFVKLAQEFRRVGYDPYLRWSKAAQGAVGASVFGAGVGAGRGLEGFLQAPEQIPFGHKVGQGLVEARKGFAEGTLFAGGLMLGQSAGSALFRGVKGLRPKPPPMKFLGEGRPEPPFPRGGPGASHYNTQWAPPRRMDVTAPGGSTELGPEFQPMWDELVRLAQSGNKEALRTVEQLQGKIWDSPRLVATRNMLPSIRDGGARAAELATREQRITDEINQERIRRVMEKPATKPASKPATTPQTLVKERPSPELREVQVEADREKTLRIDALTRSQDAHVGTIEFGTELPGHLPIPILAIDGRLVALDQVFNVPHPTGGDPIPVSMEMLDVQDSVAELSIHPSSNPRIVTPPDSPIVLQLNPDGTLDIASEETALRQAGWQGQLAHDLAGGPVDAPITDLPAEPIPRATALNADEHSDLTIEQIQTEQKRKRFTGMRFSVGGRGQSLKAGVLPGPQARWNPAWPEETELVPVEELKKIQMHRPLVPPELKDEISQRGFTGKAFTLPLLIEADQERGFTILGDGNTRLEAAIQAGVPNLPAVVVRRDPRGMQEPREGFAYGTATQFPKDFSEKSLHRPSSIGLPTVDTEWTTKEEPEDTGPELSLEASYGGSRVSTDVNVANIKKTMSATLYPGDVAISGAIQNGKDSLPRGVPPEKWLHIDVGALAESPDTFKYDAEYALNHLGSPGRFFSSGETPPKQFLATTVMDRGSGVDWDTITKKFIAIGEKTDKWKVVDASGGKGIELYGILSAGSRWRVATVCKDPKFDNKLVIHLLEGTRQDLEGDGPSTITVGTWEITNHNKDAVAPSLGTRFGHMFRSSIGKTGDVYDVYAPFALSTDILSAPKPNPNYNPPEQFVPLGETVGEIPEWGEEYFAALVNDTRVSRNERETSPANTIFDWDSPHGTIVSILWDSPPLGKTFREMHGDFTSLFEQRISSTNTIFAKGYELIRGFNGKNTKPFSTPQKDIVVLRKDDTGLIHDKAPVTIYRGPIHKSTDSIKIYHLNNGYTQFVRTEHRWRQLFKDTPKEIYVDIGFSFARFPTTPEGEDQARELDPWNIQRTALVDKWSKKVNDFIDKIIRSGEAAATDETRKALADAINKGLQLPGRLRYLIHQGDKQLPDDPSYIFDTFRPMYQAMETTDSLCRAAVKKEKFLQERSDNSLLQPESNRALGISFLIKDWYGLANIKMAEEVKKATQAKCDNIWTLCIPGIIKETLVGSYTFQTPYFKSDLFERFLEDFPYKAAPTMEQYEALVQVVEELTYVSLHEIAHLLDTGKSGHEAGWVGKFLAMYTELSLDFETDRYKDSSLAKIAKLWAEALEPWIITPQTAGMKTSEVRKHAADAFVTASKVESWKDNEYDWTRAVEGVHARKRPGEDSGNGGSSPNAPDAGGHVRQRGAEKGVHPTRGTGRGLRFSASSSRRGIPGPLPLRPVEWIGFDEIPPTVFDSFTDEWKIEHLKARYTRVSHSAQFRNLENLHPDLLEKGRPGYIGDWRPNPAQLAELKLAYAEAVNWWFEGTRDTREDTKKFLSRKLPAPPKLTPRQIRTLIDQVANWGPKIDKLSDEDFDLVMQRIFEYELPDSLRNAWIGQLNNMGADFDPQAVANITPQDWGQNILWLNEIVRRFHDIPDSPAMKRVKELKATTASQKRMFNFILNNLDELDRKMFTARSLFGIFGRPERTLGAIRVGKEAAEIDMYRSVFFLLENGNAKMNAEFEEKMLKLRNVFTLMEQNPELEHDIEQYFTYGMWPGSPGQDKGYKGRLGLLTRTKDHRFLDIIQQLKTFFQEYFNEGEGSVEKAAIEKLNANIATLALYIEQQKQVIIADLEVCKAAALRMEESLDEIDQNEVNKSADLYDRLIKFFDEMRFEDFAEKCVFADKNRYKRTEPTFYNLLSVPIRARKSRDELVRWGATVAQAWSQIQKHRGQREAIKSGRLSNMNPIAAMREILKNEYATHHRLSNNEKLRRFFTPDELESIVRGGTIGSFAADLAVFLSESVRMVHFTPAIARVRNQVNMIVQTGKARSSVEPMEISEGMWQQLPIGQKVLLFFLFNIMEGDNMDPMAEKAMLDIMAAASSGKTSFFSNIQSFFGGKTGAQRAKENPLAARVATPSAGNELIMPMMAYFYSVMLSFIRTGVINALDVMNLAYIMWEQTNPLAFARHIPWGVARSLLDVIQTAGAYAEASLRGRIHQLPESRRVGSQNMAVDLAEITAFSISPSTGENRNPLGELVQIVAAASLSLIKAFDLWARGVTYYACKNYFLGLGIEPEVAIGMARERQAWLHTMSGLLVSSVYMRNLSTKIFRPLLTYMAARAEDTADMATVGAWGPATRAILPEKYTGKSWLRPGLDQEREAGGPIYSAPPRKGGGGGGGKPPDPPASGLSPEEAEWWNRLNLPPLPVGWGYMPSKRAQMGRLRALTLGTFTAIPLIYFSTKGLGWVGKKAGGLLGEAFDNTEDALFESSLWLPSQIGFPMIRSWGENMTWAYLSLKKLAYELEMASPLSRVVPFRMQRHEMTLLNELNRKRKAIMFIPATRDFQRLWTKQDKALRDAVGASQSLTPSQSDIDALVNPPPVAPSQPPTGRY